MTNFLQYYMLEQKRHKVFVSYHHANDQVYRDSFEYLFTNINEICVSKSVKIGDIDSNLKTETIRQKIRDEYLHDSTGGPVNRCVNRSGNGKHLFPISLNSFQ